MSQATLTVGVLSLWMFAGNQAIGKTTAGVIGRFSQALGRAQTEGSNMDNHHQYIRRCIKLAEQAKQGSNFPFGALLVRNDVIVMEAENSTVTDRDATRHAELNLVSKAC